MFRHRGAAFIALAAAVVVCWSASAVLARAQDEPLAEQEVPEGYIKGEPITLGPGITETVQEIMDREARRPFGAVAPRRQKPERMRPFQPRPNPESPEVSRWPVSEPADEPEIPEYLQFREPRLPQTVGTDFLGILGGDTNTPPDTIGDVGPTQILVATNQRIKLFDKAGNPVGTPVPLDVTSDSFFASVSRSGNMSDPHVRYDRLSGRWFLVAIEVGTPQNPICPNRVLLAVSSSSTITNTSSFTFHQFIGQTDAFTDYPTLGVDRHAIYIGGNQFPDGDCPGSIADIQNAAWVVNKANLLANVLTVTPFLNLLHYDADPLQEIGPWTPQGVQNDDPAATEGYFIGVDFFFFGRMTMRRVVNPGGTPSLSGNIAVTVPATHFPLDQGQPGGAPTLDGLDDRPFAADMRKNKVTGGSTLWTAHNMRVNTSGVASGSGTRNGSRWYQIQNLSSTPTLAQSGTLFDSAVSTPFGFWIPSIAMSGQGHAALGASRASTNDPGGHASTVAAGRLRTDTTGTLQAATLTEASTFHYDIPWCCTTVERWGDYSQTVVDPNDDQTMWTFQEYAGAADRWAVRVTQLKAPPPATPASTAPANICFGRTGTTVTLTGTTSSGSEFFDPGPDVGGPGFPNHLQASSTGGVTVNSASFVSPTQVSLNLHTVSATAGAKNITVTNPDGQSAAGGGSVFSVTLMTVNPSTIPAGTTGSLYNQTFTQSGGSGTPDQIRFGLAGDLPAGLTFNTTTGVLDGTPTEAGIFPITVSATDTNACGGSRAYNLTIGVPSVVSPVALAVDTANNSVFEPGETVVVAPSWFNGGSDTSITGAATNFDGPPGPTYSTPDGAASYTLPSNQPAGCGGNCYSFAISSGARPASHWDSTFTETPSSGSPKVWTVHIGNSFSDVTTANGFYRQIEAMLHRGVTNGCAINPLRYCPSSTTTREQMAKFLLAAKEGPSFTPPACNPSDARTFADVPASNGFCPFIEELARRNITSGCALNPLRYCPTGTVTREAMAKFVLLTANPGLIPPACSAGQPRVFDDVGVSNGFCPFVEELFRRGIVSGCQAAPALYCGTNNVTREQMSKFLGQTFGLSLYGL